VRVFSRNSVLPEPGALAPRRSFPLPRRPPSFSVPGGDAAAQYPVQAAAATDAQHRTRVRAGGGGPSLAMCSGSPHRHTKERNESIGRARRRMHELANGQANITAVVLALEEARPPLAPRARPRHRIDESFEGVVMKKTLSAIANLAGAVTLMMVGYVVLTSLPDRKRYIRISTM
jgi:hypothetical protein